MHKKETKIWLAVFISFAFCISLLFPVVGQFIIAAVERLFFHRDLRDDKWLVVLRNAGIWGAVVITVCAFQILKIPALWKKRFPSGKPSLLKEAVSPKTFLIL